MGSVLVETNHQYRERISGVFKGHYATFAGGSTLGPVHGAIMVEYDDDPTTYFWKVTGRPAALMRGDAATPIFA